MKASRRGSGEEGVEAVLLFDIKNEEKNKKKNNNRS